MPYISVSTPHSHSKLRSACGCMPTVDNGDYNCCSHGCRYCYANYNEKQIAERMKLHDPKSSILLGHLDEEDHITIRGRINTSDRFHCCRKNSGYGRGEMSDTSGQKLFTIIIFVRHLDKRKAYEALCGYKLVMRTDNKER